MTEYFTFTWFHYIEKKFWGDNIESNRYFASSVMMLMLVCGVITSVVEMVNTSDDMIVIYAFFLVIVCGTMVCESIIAARKPSVAILRSLMMVILIPLSFGLGIAAGLIVMLLIALWLIITFIGVALNGGSSKGKKKIILDDGTTLTENKDLLGGTSSYSGSDGKEYEHITGSDLYREK